MASSYAILLDLLGVPDVVDRIIDMEAKSRHNDVLCELQRVNEEANKTLLQVASDLYDELGDGRSFYTMLWQEALKSDYFIWEHVSDHTYKLLSLPRLSTDKATFLSQVMTLYSSPLSRKWAIKFMRYVMETYVQC